MPHGATNCSHLAEKKEYGMSGLEFPRD